MKRAGRQITNTIIKSFDFWSKYWTQLTDLPHPRPWFNNEEEAYQALWEIVRAIEKVEPKMQFDARYKFVRFSIAEMYLKECPSYLEFWLMTRPDYIAEIEQKYASYETMINRSLKTENIKINYGGLLTKT